MPFAEQALIDELARLERAGDIAAALRLLGAQPLTPNLLVNIAIALYRHDLSALAFVIVQKLLEAGMDHGALHAFAAHVAIRLRRADAAASSIARLAQLTAAENATQRDAARALIEPLLMRDAVMAFHRGDHATAHAYSQLWAAIDPQTGMRLAPPPAGRAPDYARLLQPDNGAGLQRLELRVASLPRVARHAVLGIRDRWVPGEPRSREHDIPPRCAFALQSYGWQTRRHDRRSLDDAAIIAEDFRALAALCHETHADVLILDEFQPAQGKGAAGEIIAALRRERPALKLVGLYFDPWAAERWDAMEAGAQYLDCAWSGVPTPVWQRPAFAGKTLLLPYPIGGSYPTPPPLAPRFRFGGGVQLTNWDRAFWAAAMVQAGLPLRIEASNHQDDRRDPFESYRAYMLRGQTGEATLNFARRMNGVCTITGRTFETLGIGGLLVQERADEIDLFFTAGRHYLRFETLTDLFDIAALLRDEPGRADDIRREGAAFFAEHYGDERLIGYLDQFLFHRDSTARAAA